MDNADAHELILTPEPIHHYCVEHSTPPSAVLQELIATTRSKMGAWQMQVGPMEGRFLSLLTGLMNAKNVLEFGTFTGYSSLSFAEGLPENGKVVTLDRDPNATNIAKQFWAKSPHGKKIELILGNAHETIHALQSEIASHQRPQFDLAFIDADKGGYSLYWEAALKLVRRGGAILVDNVLWSGRILNPSDKSDHTMHAFNEMAKKDARVDLVMLPIRDGILMAKIK